MTIKPRSFQHWQQMVTELKRESGHCPIAPIPDKAAAWFDCTRKYLSGTPADEALVELKSLQMTAADAWELPWKHQQIGGWFLSLTHYTRNEVPHWLLTIVRHAPTVTDGDIRKRNDYIKLMGADPETDLLMYTGPDEDQKSVAHWTWPKQRNQS